MKKNKITSALNDLLTRNYDAKKGYIEAGNKVTEARLREWLFSNSKKRDCFIEETEERIKALGGMYIKGDSFFGTLHRAWLDVKSDIAEDNISVINECITGEKRALEDYNEVLSNVQMDNETKKMITRQKDNIEDSLKSLRGIEKTLELALNQ